MAQKGYFSGKTEYQRNNRPGGAGKPGGYGKQNDSGKSGNYGAQGGSDKPGGYGKQGSYGKQGGYGKPGYNRSEGDGYHRAPRDGEQGGYGAQGDSSKPGGYGKQGGYGKPGGYGKQGGYGKPGYNRSEGDGYHRAPRDGDQGGYGTQGVSSKPGGYGKQGGYGKPGYNRSEGDGYHRAPRDGAERPRYEERNRPVEAEPSVQQDAADELPFLIIGRNAVREAVKAGRSIDRILISAEPDGSLREIAGLARDRKILVRETARKALDELCMPFGHGGKTANHQGIVAYAAGVEYCSVADILDQAKKRGEAPFVIVLDGIMDPHNLGSIIRSADCAGAHGVIIGKRRSASVTAATVKAAAGATEHVSIARVTNIPAAIAELKKANVWIAGADMKGKPMGEQALSGALALVIGGEGEGLGKLVADSCDFIVSIPMFGPLDSLNASVAAGILMFEKRRQDAAQVQK